MVMYFKAQKHLSESQQRLRLVVEGHGFTRTSRGLCITVMIIDRMITCHLYKHINTHSIQV